jgi:hypothetical protein
MRTVAARDDLSPAIRIPRLPQLRPGRCVLPVALALSVWLLVVGLIGAHQMKVVLSSADWASVVGAFVVVRAATIGQGLVLWGGVASKTAYAALQTYTVGFAALETSRAGWVPPEKTSRMADELVAMTSPKQFASGLRYLLAGIQREAGTGPKKGRPSVSVVPGERRPVGRPLLQEGVTTLGRLG